MFNDKQNAWMHSQHPDKEAYYIERERKRERERDSVSE